MQSLASRPKYSTQSGSRKESAAGQRSRDRNRRYQRPRSKSSMVGRLGSVKMEGDGNALIFTRSLSCCDILVGILYPTLLVWVLAMRSELLDTNHEM